MCEASAVCVWGVGEEGVSKGVNWQCRHYNIVDVERKVELKGRAIWL